MKKLILFLGLLLLTTNLFAQKSAYNKTIYKDYGTFKVENGNNLISISAFITIEDENDVVSHDNKTVKQKKYEQSIYDEKKYHYELYMVSKSIFEGDTTSTWLYGVKIFINGEDVLNKQFPNGFIISIKTIPTLIHTHHSYTKDVKFEIKWEKAVYEPRIRK